MWGLIIGAIILVLAIGLHVDSRISVPALIALLIFALVSGIVIADPDAIKKLGGKVGSHEIALERFEKAADKITKEKMEEIGREIEGHKKVINRMVEQTIKIVEMLKQVAEEAALPMLSLHSKDIKRVDNGIEIRLILKPSKNKPFAWLAFRAEIVGDSEALIQKFSPYEMYVWYPPDKEHEDITDEGRTASIQYIPQGTTHQRLLIQVSNPCKLKISSNHIIEPLELDVE